MIKLKLGERAMDWKGQSRCCDTVLEVVRCYVSERMNTIIQLHIITKALLTHSLFISFCFYLLGGKNARHKLPRFFWPSIQNMVCLPPLSLFPSLLPSLFLYISLSHIFMCTSLFHQNGHMADLNLKQS